MEKLTLCAPCLFGLESVLSYEVRRIGGENVRAEDGRVLFEGGEELVAKANLWLRTAERVSIVLGMGEAATFDQLFDLVAGLPLERFVGRTDAFPVKGWSLKSALHSIPDIQAIVKRAAVKRLEKAYGQSWFEETGPVHQIRFSLLRDNATIMLDTSGAGLHKRGYRRTSTAAPIKETLAAGILDLARVRGDSRVLDPMCGSGTFLIEAALRAHNIAPGIRRPFAAEQWGCFDKAMWKEQRRLAGGAAEMDRPFTAQGWDIDPAAVALSRDNAAKAGVAGRVRADCRDIADFDPGEGPGVILCNPPYGERLLERRQAEDLYRAMGKAFPRREGLSYYIISPHEDFERLFGRRADKRRKLYNGMIKCQLFLYFK